MNFRTLALPSRLALLLVAAALVPGCEALQGPKIDLTADPDTISAGGFATSTITAVVTIGAKPRAGKSVTFTTQTGSFSETAELTETIVATDAEGKATVTLWSDTAVGQTQVTAEFTDDESGQTALANITVTFEAPTDPVDGRFTLQCDQVNVGGFWSPQPDIHVPCSMSAQTIGGNAIPVSALNPFFLAEAGVLETYIDDNTGQQAVRYRVRGGNAAPLDVPPATGEPSRTGSLGEERNPRDGVVSLLAVVRGTEAYMDLNGNGVRDDIEPFTDIGEPFLDVDDDGVFTLGTDEYFDSNQNGQYDGPNGRFDAQTFIGAQTKIVWSGPLREDPTGIPDPGGRLEESGSTTIGDGGQFTLNIYLLDRNLNPVVAFPANSDYMEVTDNSGYLTMTPDPSAIALTNTIGMTFHPDGGILTFAPDTGLVSVLVQDYSPGTVENPVVPFTLSVTFYVTPGQDSIFDYLNQTTDNFLDTVGGTVE